MNFGQILRIHIPLRGMCQNYNFSKKFRKIGKYHPPVGGMIFEQEMPKIWEKLSPILQSNDLEILPEFPIPCTFDWAGVPFHRKGTPLQRWKILPNFPSLGAHPPSPSAWPPWATTHGWWACFPCLAWVGCHAPKSMAHGCTPGAQCMATLPWLGLPKFACNWCCMNLVCILALES